MIAQFPIEAFASIVTCAAAAVSVQRVKRPHVGWIPVVCSGPVVFSLASSSWAVGLLDCATRPGSRSRRRSPAGRSVPAASSGSKSPSLLAVASVFSWA